jgi:ADP-ribose pyrophosphatase YjhB (NUDIX family)
VTIWTPSPFIRVKVLGLAWRGEDLLLAEVEDSAGRVKGLRPLGGGIEFGETREQALGREFAEELGCAMRVAGPWHGFENIYEHEGAVGHEFLFAANVELEDGSLYRRDSIPFLEDEGTACLARWVAPAALAPGVELYPAGLTGLIEAGIVAPGG